jgi:hypothetical protein
MRFAGPLAPAASAALTAWVLCATPTAVAQMATPLFASSDRLELVLQAPMRQLTGQRSRRPTVDGQLIAPAAEGSETTFDVAVSARGNNRLDVCTFPPLSFTLDDGQTRGTLFAGQNRLELSTRCRQGEAYAQYVELEYLIYRMFERVSDIALAVRPADMRYVDTVQRNREQEGPAFFVERFERLADRLGMTIADVERIEVAELDRPSLAKLSLFQYVIGNTDWSAIAGSAGERCCHNVAAFTSTEAGRTTFVVVPYDFDQAGMIDAPYALPSEQLGIRSVTDRLYRGLCITNELLDGTIAAFNAARPDMEALLESARLNPATRNHAGAYLARSFEILNDPAERQREIDGACRGE